MMSPDDFQIPWLELLAGLPIVFGALLALRIALSNKTPLAPSQAAQKPKPKEFNDDDHRKTDSLADDADLSARATDDDLSKLADSNAKLRSELDNL